jgi:hypothetical protein
MERSLYDRDGFQHHVSRGKPRPSRLGETTPRAADAIVAVSHVETIKRVCKFSLMILLLTAVFAAIVALKVAIWIPRFSH